MLLGFKSDKDSVGLSSVTVFSSHYVLILRKQSSMTCSSPKKGAKASHSNMSGGYNRFLSEFRLGIPVTRVHQVLLTHVKKYARLPKVSSHPILPSLALNYCTPCSVIPDDHCTVHRSFDDATPEFGTVKRTSLS
jgi:hypothetical protein